MNRFKQFTIGSLALVMAFAMAAGVAPSVSHAAAGDLVKSADSSTVYIVAADGVTILPFTHERAYLSWGFSADSGVTPDFSGVMTADLSSYTVGPYVEFRSGTLLRSLTEPDVFYIDGEEKRPILDETTFLALGLDWDDVEWTTQDFLDDYTEGAMISDASMHVDGQIVKYADDPALYLLDGGMTRAFQSADAFEANRYYWDNFVVIPDTETYPAGDMVYGYESDLALPVGVGAAAPPVPSGSGLNVALASSNAAATTIVADTTTGGAQMLIPFLTHTFSASSDGDVTITNLRFKRTGISADSDILNTYLYDVDGNRLALGGSLSSNYLTFNDASGLFTVPSGTSMDVVLKADLKRNTGSGKTIGFDLESASDVTTTASVSGVFPISGNLMTTAQAFDLGYATVAGSYTTPTTDNTSINADQDEVEVWKFNYTASDQDLLVHEFKMTKVGSVLSDDLQDFALYANGSLIGSGVQMNDDFEVIFDLSSSPLEIEKGQTKTMSLRANIVKGSSRDFKFTFQYQDDIKLWDENYQVYVPTILTGNTTNDTWSVIQPTGDHQIASGSLSISKATDSPSGNISKGASNILLARYEVKASGEDVKVNSLGVSAQTSSSDAGMDNGRLLLDGVQVGSTSDIGEYNSTTTYTFGTNFIAQAGETHILEVYGDVKTTAGTDLAADETTAIYLAAGSSNAQGQSSLTSLSVPASEAAGNTVTVKAGSLSLAELTSYGDQTMVAGAKNVKIGAFTILAGSSEGVDLDGITAALDSTEQDDIENLYLMIDGAQFGNTKVDPTTSNLFSGSLSIGAGVSKVAELYADIKSSTTGSTVNAAMTGTGVGQDSSDSVTASSVVMQTITFGTGSLTASLDASSPKSDIILAGSTGVELAKFKFSATTDTFTVNKLTLVTATVTASSSEDNFNAIHLSYPKEDGSTGSATGYFGSSGSVTFVNLGFFIDRDDDAVLTVSADLASIGLNGANADSGDTPRIDFDVNDEFEAVSGSGTTDTDASTGSVVSISSDVTSNMMVVRKTRPTVSMVSLPSTVLVNGSNKVISKFSISADSKGEVSVYKLGWDISLTGPGNLDVTSPVLYDTADNSSLTASSTDTATASSYIRIEFDNSSTEQLVVGAGATKTYELKATIANSDGSGDSISTNLGSPYTTNSLTDTAYLIAVNENNFIWSDNASSTQSDTAYNWANGRYVKTLPSDSQNLITASN